jgi:16S rRNA (adenine1518-N6/adenine1519-N6)-dimethyltransferase
MGVLTKYLCKNDKINLKVIEIDTESVLYLNRNFDDLCIIEGDFLRIDIDSLFDGNYAVIGNFPYNISSQILFRVLENRDKVPYLVGMFQKEVATRIASKSGNKDYGILSVLLQAFYDIEYLFTVDEHVFNPPPKVKSAVISMVWNNVQSLDCDEKKFITVVKTAFNQRRKTLRNALSSLVSDKQTLEDSIFNKRAEQLSVEDFVKITGMVLGN